MDYLACLRSAILLVLVDIHLNTCYTDFQKQYQQFMAACAKLGKRPNFEEELLIGKPWRVYYTWNLEWEEKCIDITFKHATDSMINRVWHDMNDYLRVQPEWQAATILMTMGTIKNGREMLLFPGAGPAGDYHAVHNMLYEGSNTIPKKKDVPLIIYQLKFFHGNRFLVLMDCGVGVTVLAARPDWKPYRLEIAGVADTLRLTHGRPACLHDENHRGDEQFVLIEYNETSSRRQ